MKRLVAVLLLLGAAGTGRVHGDSIDDAEAKKRGVPVAVIFLERQLEQEKRKTAELTAWEDDLPAANPDSRRIGAISISGTQAYIQLMADAGVIKAAIPASEVVTDEFIAFANDFDHQSIQRFAMPPQ